MLLVNPLPQHENVFWSERRSLTQCVYLYGAHLYQLEEGRPLGLPLVIGEVLCGVCVSVCGGMCSLSMFLVSQCAGLVVLKQQDSLPEGPVDSLGERHC